MSELRVRGVGRRHAAALAPLLLALAGCGSLFGGEITVRATLAPGANQETPVAVDLVFVRDRELLETLLGLTAQDWFERREQIRRSSGEESFEARTWEWVPGQEVAPQQVSFPPGVRAVLVFAGYLAEGDHRARVPLRRDLVLHLDDEGFSVSTAP